MVTKLLSLPFRSATARDASITISGQIVAGILGAIFYAVTARALGVAEFGIFSLVIATATILKDFIDPGISAVLLRFIPSSQENSLKHAYAKYALLIKASYFLVLTPLILVFARPISILLFKYSLPGLIPLTLLLSATFSLGFFISGLLQAHRKFLLDTSLFTFQTVLRLVLLASIIFLGVDNLRSILIINIVSYLVSNSLGLYLYKLDFLSQSISPSTKHSTHRFLFPVVLATSTNALTDRANLYITNHYTSATQVGLLSSAAQLFIPAKQIAGSLSNVFASRFASFTTTEQTRVYLKKALGLSLFLGLGLISTSLFAPIIINLMYGPEYQSAAILFQILTVAFGLLIIQVPFSALIMYHKSRTDVTAFLSLVQLIVVLGSSLLLIPSLGAVGAALGVLIANLTNFLLIIPLAFLVRSTKFDHISP